MERMAEVAPHVQDDSRSWRRAKLARRWSIQDREDEPGAKADGCIDSS